MRTSNKKRQINHVVTDMINMTVQYFRRIMSTSPAVDKNNVAGDDSDHHPVFKDRFVAATIDIVNGLLSTSLKRRTKGRFFIRGEEEQRRVCAHFIFLFWTDCYHNYHHGLIIIIILFHFLISCFLGWFNFYFIKNLWIRISRTNIQTHTHRKRENIRS